MTFQEEMQAAAEEHAQGDFDPSQLADAAAEANYICCKEDFTAGARAALNSTLVKELEAALMKNMDEWKAVSRYNGEKHLVAWQVSRDALKALRDARGDG